MEEEVTLFRDVWRERRFYAGDDVTDDLLEVGCEGGPWGLAG